MTIELIRRAKLVDELVHRGKLVQSDEDHFYPWSTGEKLAVALILNRPDLLATVNGGYTIVQAIDRVGEDWMRAVLIAAKHLDH